MYKKLLILLLLACVIVAGVLWLRHGGSKVPGASTEAQSEAGPWHVSTPAETNKCMSNLRQIGIAVQMFKMDMRTYPDFIAGPALAGVPMDKSTGMDESGKMVSLYPEYIKSVSDLQCPCSVAERKASLTDTVSDPMFKILKDMGETSYRSNQQFKLYKCSSYDCQQPPGKSDYEVHYSTTWAKMDRSGMNDAEREAFMRQLKWRNPPPDTVVTWCSNHRDLDKDGKPKPDSIDLVLFLDGSVKRVPTAQVIEWTTAWKNARP